MSKYLYAIVPESIDLVDDIGYDESELDGMTDEDVYDLAVKELSEPRVRRL